MVEALWSPQHSRMCDLACWELHCRGFRAPQIAAQLRVSVPRVVEGVRRAGSDAWARGPARAVGEGRCKPSSGPAGPGGERGR